VDSARSNVNSGASRRPSARTRALLLRRSGLDYRNIAKILDCSPSGAHLMVTRHLARLPVESATELRRHLLSRLEEVHRVNGPHVDEPAPRERRPSHRRVDREVVRAQRRTAKRRRLEQRARC
jgi:hypothetical protein